VELTFARPAALWLLPLGLLIWYWHRSRRPPARPATALWLLESGRGKNRSRHHLDVRLLLLLTSFALLVLALAGPAVVRGSPERLVVVIDASASMGANDRDGSRLEYGKTQAAKWLEKSNEAVLVRAGNEISVYGPARGYDLLPRLHSLRAGDASANLEKAAAAGQKILPGAAVLLISDSAPVGGVSGYINTAGEGQNAGITALGPDYAAVFNAGPQTWHGKLSSEGQVFELSISPQRFSLVRFADAKDSRKAEISTSDALSLDDTAYFLARKPTVRLELNDPAITRALLAVGARLSASNPVGVVSAGQPTPTPGRLPTLWFAKSAGADVVVAEVDSTDQLMQGVALTGKRFPAPEPPPGNDWRLLARSSSGQGLVWRRGGDVYLPPSASWRDDPALVVLLYNWLSPYLNAVRPLGEDGVLQPQLRGGVAYSLLNVGETNLPRPRADRLSGLKTRFSLSNWLALAAALLVLIASRLKVPGKRG